MAKIECSIDTSDKSIEVKVDGKKVDNFGYISAYSANSPYGYMFNMASVEEMEDCTKTTYWSHSTEAKEFVDDVDSFLRGLGKMDKKMDKEMDEEDMSEEDKKKMKKKMNKKSMMKTEENKK